MPGSKYDGSLWGWCVCLCVQTPQEMTCLAWAKNGQYLAVGTAKGNLLMYYRSETDTAAQHSSAELLIIREAQQTASESQDSRRTVVCQLQV